MNEIKEKLKKVWESEAGALRCGGTYSSMGLRVCLELSIEIENYKDNKDYDKMLKYLKQMTEIWRNALRKHNSQDLKFFEYNLETGLPTGEYDEGDLIVHKIKLK